MKRKIAVILAAGIDRYKEQIARDEDATLQSLARCRAQLADGVARHDGRVFNTAGDALLAEFASAVEAVRCAAAVQRDLRETARQLAAARPAGAGAAPCLSYRIGITLGDVVVQPDGDLLGDGVNVAARLQGVAAPGGIAVSRSVVEHVAAKLPLAFVDRGFHTLKNMPEPVHAFAIDLDGKPSGLPAGLGRGQRRGGWLMPAMLLAGGGLAAALAFALLPRGSGSTAPAVAPTASAPAAASTAQGSAAATRLRCAEILERAQLGRLTADDRQTLQRDCH